MSRKFSTRREVEAAALTRRRFLKEAAVGAATLALSPAYSALASTVDLDVNLATLPPLPPGSPHFAPKAKRVIYMFMVGGPSQIDLFDHKPLLNEYNGKEIPEEIVKGERFAFIRGRPHLIGSQYAFSRHGDSGAEISELLPNIAGIADKLAIVKSCQASQFNHGPAQLATLTGHQVPGRPSLGAWVSYALGTENDTIPAFTVLVSGNNLPAGGKSCWGSGFLPSVHQGVEIQSVGGISHFLTDPSGVDRQTRGRSIEMINALNARHLTDQGDPEIRTRMEAYELAYRMQESMPELMDLSGEDRALREYGANPGESSFATNCLLARRLVERGARFVQLFDWGWDHHGATPSTDLVSGITDSCGKVDRPAAALVRDLEQRGLLDETLIVWAGEFGRTPMHEGRGGSKLTGRDHHPRAFAVWFAGAGVRPGVTIGRTDEFGYNVVEDATHTHDLNATILHLLGLDHTRLTYEHLGRGFRLTDLYGHVQHKLLA